MRSVDVSNLVWGLFEAEGQFFIRGTDKQGGPTTFSVTGITLGTLGEYLVRLINYPGIFLLRYINKPGLCLGSERIAKRALECMKGVGIDTETFKAHSLRPPHTPRETKGPLGALFKPGRA